MSISQKLNKLNEPLDIDYQLMASELDTSIKRMKYLSNELMDDILILSFNSLVNDIENVEGIEITSFDDNTVLYEYLDEAVVIYTNLGKKFILFDSMITHKMENKLYSYR
jgi:orotate phosphoribosyltransferase-like protein